MSDNVEKFVLQYTVELKDTVRRLEELNEKMEKVGKSGKDSGGKFKGVFKDLKNEVAPLRSEFGAIDGIIAKLGYRVAWLAPIMAGLALTVKSIIDVRKEYEAQRALGFQAGLSPLGIEQFQREANKASGGVVGQEGARNIIQKTSDLAYSAYTNPDVMSQESLILKKLGTSAFSDNGKIKGTQKILDEISAKLQSVTKEQSIAIGALAGFSADEVKALRGRTAALKEGEKISDNETYKLQRQQAALETVRNAMGSIAEDWRRIENIVGAAVLPVFAKLVKVSADFVENVQVMWRALIDGWDDFVERFMFDLKNPFSTQKERENAAVERFVNQIVRDQQRQTEQNLRNGERSAQETRTAQAMFQRDINLFSSAVSTFAGVIDERQAWAAWAGEIGRAAGVGPQRSESANKTGATEANYTQADISAAPVPAGNLANAPSRATSYDEIYAEAAAKYSKEGVTPELLKAITQVESRFNPHAKSNADAHGLMQIIRSNFKGLGITNPYDPRQNINGGAQLIAEYLRASKGDLRTALTMYHGGYDRKGWGPLTRAYADKVFNALENPMTPKKYKVNPDLTKRGVEDPNDVNSTRPAGAAPYPVMSSPVATGTVEARRGHYLPVQGQGRENIQLRGLQSALAGFLGVPEEQVMQGFVNKGDISYARRYLQLGTQREFITNFEKARTPGVRPNVQAEAAKNARALAFQLNAFDKFGQSIEDKARPGGQEITLGQKDINIAIYEANNARTTANEVEDVLKRYDINDINAMIGSATKW